MDLMKEDNNDSLKISKTEKGLDINIPIGKPDQETTNTIWSTVIGATVAITGVVIGLFFSSSKDD
jgi:hypothetical protein